MSIVSYNVIGVMSGTSLDGLDLAYIRFNYDTSWSFDIQQAETVSYNEQWRSKLSKLTFQSKAYLHQLDAEYTQLLAEKIKNFISEHDIVEIDAVCSHGHTALHQPENGLTYQIGNRPELAKLINQKVVCDFRVQDVRLGGQGAPLVPIGDHILFQEYDYCLNLGGFANISFESQGQRVAYDICPVNIVLNHYANFLGKDYDQGGELARKSKLHKPLFDELNSLAYYYQKPPKSLGLEWVIKSVLPIVDAYRLSPEVVLRTFTEHIAFQLSENFDPNTFILVTGGGAYNTYLLELLNSYKELNVKVPEEHLVEYKEALIFGLLGLLRLRGEINCLASVTGASKNHSTGILFEP